ncbi:uncharacterized protein UHOD_11484 [Ustilago sp. UG-2017b]|nr:uncharacterized protein UHOD_11484 [Ustilago sp. UG-2017b]
MLLIGAAFLASCGWTVLVLLQMSIGALPTSSEWRLAPPLPPHPLSCPEFIIEQAPASLVWRTQVSLPPVLLTLDLPDPRFLRFSSYDFCFCASGPMTEAFNSPRLERLVRGLKRIVGNPLPVAKLPITLPLLRQLVRTLPTVCLSQHNRHMFRAAFCLAFTCFLWAGELTWDAFGPNTLTVSSVTFAADHSYATIMLPASKMDPFRQGATLLAPTVPLSTCAVACLRLICRHRAPQEPLFVLEGGQPFDRGSFVTMLWHFLEGCGVVSSSYSGHSFR